MEWAAAGGHQSARSAVHLVMRRDPKALTLFAKGAGELKVQALVQHTIVWQSLPVPLHHITATEEQTHAVLLQLIPTPLSSSSCEL